jgi:primosomal protein N''
MKRDEHESRLEALQRQVTRMEQQQAILNALIQELTAQVEALRKALATQRLAGGSVWPPR